MHLDHEKVFKNDVLLPTIITQTIATVTKPYKEYQDLTPYHDCNLQDK